MSNRTKPGPRPSTRSHRPRKPAIRTAFGPDNSLNFLRLVFAALVMIAHGWALGQFGLFRLGRYEVSALAVDSFFVISGFLVTRSNVRVGTTARFLWHRFLRIYPAFWVCLVVVAGFFAPLGWLHAHGSLDGFLDANHGPVQYIVRNSTLHMQFYDVSGTPAGNAPGTAPATGPASWNGALWSLWWEFLCYLGVAILGAIGVLRRRRVVVAVLTAVMWFAVVVHHLTPDVAGTLLGSPFAEGALRLGPLFLCGSLLFLYGDRVPVSGRLAAAAAIAVTGSMFLSEPHLILAPPLAYLCLWLGIRLPFHRIGAKNDLSYGLYIYSSPVQHLLALHGLHRHGVLVYFSAFTVGSAALAAGSWFAVEKHVLKLKHWTPGRLKTERPFFWPTQATRRRVAPRVAFPRQEDRLETPARGTLPEAGTIEHPGATGT
ncbi:acyltransferase family protein [Protofrankia symbiont of Coriaria ruscifolia]|uniref:acyltransferase family protein n=1 Tax=Protofrankia symbiont of Coriaria ruscifolia TaxID=1306542 RepID=UPI0010415D79|nr:acyltransferase [Protofrankia symbiont of Coriaria ruscifolia]